MDEINLSQFRDKFINEAHILLSNLENCLLELETAPDNKEMIESVFRVMHTLKGVSGMYGFDEIGNLTHSFETIYQMVRDGETKLTEEVFDLTFQSVDHVRNLLSDPQLENADHKFKHAELLNKVVQVLAKLKDENPTKKAKVKAKTRPKKAMDSGMHTWYILLKTNEQFEKRSINMLYILFDLSKLGTFHIEKKAPDNEIDLESDDDLWRIFLSTKATREEIEDVLIFILDDCKITKLANDNLFEISSKERLESTTDSSNTVSIIDTIEKMHQIQLGPDPVVEPIVPAQTIAERNDIIAETRKTIESRISVASEKLDTLIYLVSELVTTKSELLLSIKSRDMLKIIKAGEKIDKLTKLFRENALDIRLVPISDLFIRFKRLVRDLSRSLNKKIEMVLQGEETELDKNLIDTIAEPLMHIIRNCIDHGIEAPEVRTKKGKPEAGTIKFTAYQEGQYIYLSVSDDGKGIDPEVIKNKAIEKGFIAADAKLTTKEMYNLIFLPGLSTAESLTQVSGRGVGMDIVRNKLTELNAHIDIESEIGLGTKFTIKIHQTISILDTMLFQIEDTFFLVPVTDIEECSLIMQRDLEKFRSTESVAYHDKLIPYIDMYSIFNLKKSDEQMLKMMVINR
ncbi:MAG TPA: hypothetical protein DCQ31_13035, partial [Bacteroidales bacterium]|nr:hypothetical protein [Bacteroidales bacterium]